MAGYAPRKFDPERAELIWTGDAGAINIVNLKNTLWLDTGTPENLLKASNLIFKLKKDKRISVGNL